MRSGGDVAVHTFRNRYGSRAGRGGFTLIEIVAVLTLLAILSAVAVLRYLDIVAAARVRAMAGAAAEGRAVCSLAFARETLRAGGEPTPAAVVAAAAVSPIGGDFAYAYAVEDGRRIRITVTGRNGTPLSGVSTQVYWALP